MNKKAISSVVTTVLIILLSIIAVIILWAALKPTIQDTSGRAGTALKCTEITLEIDSCVADATLVPVVVTRSGGSGDITVRATVSDADSSGSVEQTLGPLDTRTINVPKTDLTGTLTVQVAAILADGSVCTPTRADCT